MPHRDDLYIDELALTLGAGSEFNQSVAGRHCRLKSVSVPGTEIAVETDTGVLVTMAVGDRFEAPFNSLKITAPILVDAVFVVGDGKTLSEAAAVSISGATFTPDIINTIANPADVAVLTISAVLVSVARATKRQTIIKNPVGSANSVRIGSGSVAAAAGAELDPGEAVVMDGSMAITAYNAGGGTITLSVTELDFV